MMHRHSIERAVGLPALSAASSVLLVLAVLEPHLRTAALAALAAVAVIYAAAKYRRQLAHLQVGDLIGWLALLAPLAAVVGPWAALPGLPRAAYALRLLLCAIAFLGLLRIAYRPLGSDWQPELPATLLAAWFAWLVIALTWAPDKTAGLRYLLGLGSMLVLVAATAYSGSSARRLTSLAVLMAIGYALTLIVSLWEMTTGSHLVTSTLAGNGRDTSDVTSFFYNQNNFATYLAMVWPFLLATVVLTRRPRWILLSLAGMALGLLALLHTGSRSSMIAFGVETIVLAGFLLPRISRSTRRVVAGVAIILVAGLAWLAFNNSSNSLLRQFQLANLVSSVQQGYGSGETRLSLQERGLALLPGSYFAGVGPGNAEPIMAAAEPLPEINNLHDWWLEVLVDGGVPGLLLFGSAYILLAWRTFIIGRTTHDKLLRYFSLCTFAALVGFVIGAFGPSTAINFTPMWVLLGLPLALTVRQRAVAQKAASEAESGSSLGGESGAPVVEVVAETAGPAK
jgi:teichuronic acid biosynthesis protein TuaE